MQVLKHGDIYYSFSEVDRIFLDEINKMKFSHIGINSYAGYFQFTTLGSGLHVLTFSGLLSLTPTLAPWGLEVTSSCWY